MFSGVAATLLCRHEFPQMPSMPSVATCAVHHSHSNPHGLEDLQLLPLVIHAASTSGTDRRASFVEMGAFDGLSGSNTFMYERCLNWSGILIEANVNNFRALLRSGRASAMVNAGACNDVNGSLHITSKGGTVAGDLAITHPQERWNRERGTNFDIVPCSPLLDVAQDALFRKHGCLPIPSNLGVEPGSHRHMRTQACFIGTFFSLDVEGSESTVMQTLKRCLHHFPFDVLLVEESSASQTISMNQLMNRSKYVKINHFRPARIGGRNALYVVPWLENAANALLQWKGKQKHEATMLKMLEMQEGLAKLPQPE
eukprot:CAMPEP_0115835328 /NCGR_PEP_ID=MMETSP0287-20121206/4138_1 /TAXON_ID=412157 /ORGANISM="Chrysochromulina rotalis, Strain UIO044" /LENGTH=312 /DNA_ID=CAMNT_0003288783 /DNA_START=220 /DNA_END=1158 /DNA_ORIENTATION=-